MEKQATVPAAAERDGSVLLKMEGINKAFPGVKALDNVSLTVKAGTVHALMGERRILIFPSCVTATWREERCG